MTARPLVCVLAALAAGSAAAQERTSPRDGWDFAFKPFAIGAWWGPDATDAELAAYRQAGFNIVMCGRYMQLDDYGHADRGLKELDLARKHGLAVMFDTYTKNDKPWGGKAGQLDGHPTHHAASLVELQWLHKRLGKHPALIGFMIGDDKSALTPRLADCTAFLRSAAPHLMPWICQNRPNPQSLAEHGNPIFNPQIYPTLYDWASPADAQARSTCASFAMMRRACRDHDLLFWPMINVASQQKDARGFAHLASDSLARFPIFAAVAYGAQGLWYFTYNGGALQAKGPHATEQAVKKALTPLYPIVQKANGRLAQWGPRLLGRECVGLFATAWTGSGWPFDPPGGAPTRENLTAPGQAKIIEAMSGQLLVGILTREGEPPLAMVVDCRTSKGWADLPPRQVEITFHSTVDGLAILDGEKPRQVEGRFLELTLPAGGGQLVELRGPNAAHLATMASIYITTGATRAPEVARRRLTDADLKSIRAAVLAIEIFGANPEPQYADKRITLNGTEIGAIPPNGRDSWDRRAIELKPDALARVGRVNQVTILGKGVGGDAWKCRGATLAVQLADGAWATTTTHPTTFGTRGWAYSEGTPFPATGVVGPLELKFP